MKKYIFLFGALLLFALVWAAGHDILKGEQDVWMEWTMVVLGLLVSGIILAVKGSQWRKNHV